MWSRVGSGSTTVVSSSAKRPARRTADFTWALATGSSSVLPWTSPPVTVSGAWPSVVTTSAPMSRSGSATRSIGRVLSDASPVRVNVPGWPASTPASSRMSVPAFRQSRGTDGCSSPRRPAPKTRSVVSSAS